MVYVAATARTAASAGGLGAEAEILLVSNQAEKFG